MQPCWCPHEPVLCSQGGRSSCSLTMTPWLPTAGLMQRLQTLDTQLDCGSCNPIPAFSNREWGPYDCTLSSARLWLGLPCDAIQIQSSLQKPTWKQPLWNLHGGVQSMPFPHILSQNLRRGKNSWVLEPIWAGVRTLQTKQEFTTLCPSSLHSVCRKQRRIVCF